DGFLKVYREDRDDEDINEDEQQEGMLPPLAVNQQLPLNEMKAIERFSRPSPRYTEASLVKKLEELGIGRPSTFAPTIGTIQKRGYVEKKEREGIIREYRVLTLKDKKVSTVKESETIGTEKSKLFPTDIGMLVNDFLMQHFKEVMDYSFTAEIEKEFDEISNGMKKWEKVIDEFYNPFHKDVESTMENAKFVTGERVLGTDPKTGKKVIARMGKYGPMVQIGAQD